MREFLERGGTGNPSIDRFAAEDLVQHAGERYSNTHLLVDRDDHVVAFAANAMGIISLTSQEMLSRNMIPTSHEIPALFLHRLGVLKQHQRTGLAVLLIYRLFESLRHVCGHTAAACIALLVERNNNAAKALYCDRFCFQAVQTKDRHLDLLALGYPEAMEQLTQLAKTFGREEDLA